MRQNSVLYIFILTILSSTIFGKPNLDSLITAGNEQSFQFNFVAAQKTFDTIIKYYPESSQGYYFIGRNSLWFYLANKDEASKEKFKKYNKIALEKAENEYSSNSDSPKFNYYLGNIYLLNSIYNSSEQNSMDAFLATKKAVSYLESSIELNEKYFEPRLSLGTIQYALGFVPGFLGWAISIAGLEGDKIEGIKNIKLALENCKSCKVEATYHLSKIYTEYNAMYDKAELLIAKIMDNYPRNELFLYQYAILQIDLKDLIRAEEILNIMIYEFPNHYFKQTYALSFFLKGEINFKRNRFKEAIKDYESFISKATSPDYTGFANLKIALSYEMLNQKLNAQKHYILARNGNQSIAEDLSANELSKKYFDKVFSDNDKILIQAKNNNEAGNYDKAIEVLKKYDEKNSTKESLFEANVLKIDIFQNLKQFDKPIEIFNKYKKKSAISSFKDYPKYLYLRASQKFNDKKYADSRKDILDAFKVVDESDNKLQRLLVNLQQKLAEKKNNH